VLAADGTLESRPHVYCAGQITGVEGYVESAASGHIAARRLVARLRGSVLPVPPPTTAMGALLRHVSGEAHPEGYDYQPSNVVFALFPPLEGRHRKSERKTRYVARAREDLAAWAAAQGIPLRPLALGAERDRFPPTASRPETARRPMEPPR
jgi:methylenetetrahydrofolate--tRNA-(uracil-5-)-methyltransferase